METLDRMAIVVFPREPVVDWVNEITPDEPLWLDDLAMRGNIYLIPRFETLEEAEMHVEGMFDDIFCNELADWIEDQKLWPTGRTFEMFSEWFDVLYDVVAYDTVRGDIGKQEEDLQDDSACFFKNLLLLYFPLGR
ncbi:MAG: hypothetical protein HQL18_00070 [Candidatus Omnitrophica bacterium]|nr:hypothetical protein [Candidatus Omnitrophota bacterium]